MALCNNMPTTDESTPPLMPVITFPLSPTIFLISLTASKIKFSAVQFDLHFEILKIKLYKIFFPSSV